MEQAEKADELETGQQNRRTAPRYGVDENACLLLVKHGSTFPCRVVDISLSGCRMRTHERFLAGMLVRVEVTFKVRGFAFRFSGVTQWTDGRHLVGVRFVDATSRRRDELAAALGEVAEVVAAKAQKQAAEKRAAEEQVAAKLAAKEQAAAMQVAGRLIREQAGLPPPQSRPSLQATAAQAPLQPRALSVLSGAGGPQLIEPQKAAAKPASPPPAKPSKRERRVQSRHGIDTSAVIFLVNAGSRLNGRILDLSLSGCRIRTDERFPVGIYTRVEIEFRLEGLPFRLGGVIQAIHDRQHVGIRFLDMSSRKRKQVEQLIEEMQDLDEEQELAAPLEGPASLGEPSPL